MERYGSDKPDVRFGMELVELTEVFAGTEFKAFQAPCVKGIRVPGGAELSRKQLDDLTDKAKRWGAKGLVWMRVTDDAPRQPGGQVPVRRRARRHRAGARRASPATCCCSWPTSGPWSATCSACCASSSAARR